jgi:hypothetical protein
MTSIFSRIQLLLLPILLFQYAIGAPHAHHVKRNVTSLSGPLIPPNEDAFYKPPQGYESAALGSILRYRPIPNPFSFNNKTGINLKSAWQIQYRTQNSVGQPEASIVTILVPYNPKPQHLFAYAYITVCVSYHSILPWTTD